jgi:hypothetical protein
VKNTQNSTQKAFIWNSSNTFSTSKESKIEEHSLMEKIEKVEKGLRW